MDLTERPICFSFMPPAFMTGQACHIIHPDCPTVSILANARSDPAHKQKYNNYLFTSNSSFVVTFLNLLNGLKLVFLFKKVVIIHFTQGEMCIHPMNMADMLRWVQPK